MSSSSSSKPTEASHTEVPEEYDSFDREAHFFLCTRPLKDSVLGHAEHIELHHWALIAIFRDESVRTLEGFESGGKLVPHYLKERPQDSRGEKYWKLIPMKTSPHKLREVAVRNSLNGTTYSPTSNNCQDWVKAAAKAISSNLVTALKTYRTNGELNIIEKTGKCSWASSRSSSVHISSSLKQVASVSWSNSTNLEEHKLE